MTICLDTDVLVDCLRGNARARTWLETVSNETFVVPGVVAMELIQGCRNQEDLKHTQEFLNAFVIVWPEGNDFRRAFDLLVFHHLSSGLNIPDCLIAAMALERSMRLNTFNLKHYRVIPGLDVQEPYQRQ